jgi:hypothetical protein
MISVEFLVIEGFLSFAFLETVYVTGLLMFTVWCVACDHKDENLYRDIQNL